MRFLLSGNVFQSVKMCSVSSSTFFWTKARTKFKTFTATLYLRLTVRVQVPPIIINLVHKYNFYVLFNLVSFYSRLRNSDMHRNGAKHTISWIQFVIVLIFVFFGDFLALVTLKYRILEYLRLRLVTIVDRAFLCPPISPIET